MWAALKSEAARQNLSVFERSPITARLVGSAYAAGKGEWFSDVAVVGATRTGQMVATMLLDHYRETPAKCGARDISSSPERSWDRTPRAAVGQFAPLQRTN